MTDPTPPNTAARIIEVRTGHGELLFKWNAEKQQIEVKHGEQAFYIPVWQIEAFARTSQREIFKVYADDGGGI